MFNLHGSNDDEKILQFLITPLKKRKKGGADTSRELRVENPHQNTNVAADSVITLYTNGPAIASASL